MSDGRKRHLSRVSCGAGLVWLLASLTVAGQTPERSRTEGLKETDRFIKAGGATSESVALAKVEMQKTLTAYNNLVTQPSKNMKGDYKKLIKSMDSMNSHVNAAAAKVEGMQSVSDTYFQGRAETLKNIEDPSLQSRARERMQESQKAFDAVLASLREADAAFEPFRKQLADHITFLGSDLNPSATASLRPEADKLNADGAKIFAQADEAITRANDYFRSLKGSS